MPIKKDIKIKLFLENFFEVQNFKTNKMKEKKNKFDIKGLGTLKE